MRRFQVPGGGDGRPLRGEPATVRGRCGRRQVHRQGHETVRGRVRPVPTEHRHRRVRRRGADARLLRLHGFGVPDGRRRMPPAVVEHYVHVRVQGAMQSPHQHDHVRVRGQRDGLPEGVGGRVESDAEHHPMTTATSTSGTRRLLLHLHHHLHIYLRRRRRRRRQQPRTYSSPALVRRPYEL